MTANINEQIKEALDDLKAKDLIELDVTTLSDVMDTLIIASGTSSRHIKALATNVIEEIKKNLQIIPVGVEGLDNSDWVLVDFGDTVVHVMLPEARDFYELEKLWSASSKQDIQ